MADKFCRNCGAELKEGFSFCANCGSRILRNESAGQPEAGVASAGVSKTATGAAADEASAVAGAAGAAAAQFVPQQVPGQVQYQQPAAIQPQSFVPQGYSQLQAVPQQGSAPQQIPQQGIAPQAFPQAIPQQPIGQPIRPAKKKSKGPIIALVVSVSALVILLIVLGVWFISYTNNRANIAKRVLAMNSVNIGTKYTYYDEAFMNKVQKAEWWNYDGSMITKGVYSDDVETLAFSIRLEDNDTKSGNIYYAYYYSEDGQFYSSSSRTPVFEATVGPTYYEDGSTYYNVDCSRHLRKGHYKVYVCSDKSMSKVLMVADCQVK